MSKKLPFPSQKQLENAYSHLLGAQSVLETQWVMYSRYSRYDPRLAEIWIKRMAKEWKKLSPLMLQEKNIKEFSPATLGVLLEQLYMYLVDLQSKKIFYKWKELVMCDVKPSQGENFLIGIYPFASKAMLEQAEAPHISFKKWGFSGADILVNKYLKVQQTKQKTGLSKKVRKTMLDRFIAAQKKAGHFKFKLNDYVQFCGGHISTRVAQLDLLSAKHIRRHGRTKSRYYSTI